MARPFRVRLPLLTLLALISCAATPAFADPVLGFVEEWPGTSTQGWAGGPSHQTLRNPGTGGVGGAADGFLQDSSTVSNNYGVFKIGPEYQGNWTAAGIQSVHVWLNDVGPPNGFEIHFAFGRTSNFWQYNVGFIPASGTWSEFVVDLTDSTAFTHIISTDTLGYAWALEHNDRILLRHDFAPYLMDPDDIAGDLGIDRLSLLAAGQTGVDNGSRTPRALTLRAPQPNPSRGPVTFALETADASPVRIEVVDVQGRVVRRASLPGGIAGARAWTWDGRDHGGQIAAAGAYRVRATSATGGASRSFVLLGN